MLPPSARQAKARVAPLHHHVSQEHENTVKNIKLRQDYLEALDSKLLTLNLNPFFTVEHRTSNRQHRTTTNP
jgi:hypothetical protein